MLDIEDENSTDNSLFEMAVAFAVKVKSGEVEVKEPAPTESVQQNNTSVADDDDIPF
jgi:hypothetical protein